MESLTSTEIIEFLQPNLTDKYYINNNGIKEMLIKLINKNPFILENRFKSIIELNDFILYTEYMMYGNNHDDLERIKTAIDVKPFFRNLYKVVESYNEFSMLNELYQVEPITIET